MLEPVRRIDVIETLVSHITSLDQPTVPGILYVRDNLNHLDIDASNIIIGKIVDVLKNEFNGTIMNKEVQMMAQEKASRLYKDVLDQEFFCTSYDGVKVIGLRIILKIFGICSRVDGIEFSIRGEHEPKHRFC